MISFTLLSLSWSLPFASSLLSCDLAAFPFVVLVIVGAVVAVVVIAVADTVVVVGIVLAAVVIVANSPRRHSGCRWCYRFTFLS